MRAFGANTLLVSDTVVSSLVGRGSLSLLILMLCLDGRRIDCFFGAMLLLSEAPERMRSFEGLAAWFYLPPALGERPVTSSWNCSYSWALLVRGECLLTHATLVVRGSVKRDLSVEREAPSME